jgi:hypothetical protein
MLLSLLINIRYGDLPFVITFEKVIPVGFHVAFGHDFSLFNDKPSKLNNGIRNYYKRK